MREFCVGQHVWSRIFGYGEVVNLRQQANITYPVEVQNSLGLECYTSDGKFRGGDKHFSLMPLHEKPLPKFLLGYHVESMAFGVGIVVEILRDGAMIKVQFEGDSYDYYSCGRQKLRDVHPTLYYKGFNVAEPDNVEVSKQFAYHFEPFQKVLVRDNELDSWSVDLFEQLDHGKPFSFKGIRNCWRICIPYEGNEALLGTKQAPDTGEKE